MPTAKKRITVSLSDKTFSMFERYAELQGKSKASAVADVLEEIAPVMEGTVSLLERARTAPDAMKERLLGIFEDLEGDMLKAIEKADQKDLFGNKH